MRVPQVPIVCAWFGNAYLVGNGVDEPIWATICIAIMALVISMTFATVFACTLDTLFVCACRDKAEYTSQSRSHGAHGSKCFPCTVHH